MPSTSQFYLLQNAAPLLGSFEAACCTQSSLSAVTAALFYHAGVQEMMGMNTKSIITSQNQNRINVGAAVTTAHQHRRSTLFSGARGWWRYHFETFARFWREGRNGYRDTSTLPLCDGFHQAFHDRRLKSKYCSRIIINIIIVMICTRWCHHRYMIIVN